MENPLVSICCVTYNHAPYIRQCLEGFMMQKTDFKFEVLIHDDASTDETANIIREYESKYPEIIRPIYQKENQYSKGVKVSLTYNWSRAKGKYIALCEGDDYWTDPYKLQKQVDFLEAHSGYVLCSHFFNIFSQNQNKFIGTGPEAKTSLTYNLEMLMDGCWYNHPLTCMFSRSALDLDTYRKYEDSKDFTLFYHLLSKGKGYLFNESMGVYRIHNGGVWCGVTSQNRLWCDLQCMKGIYDVEGSDRAALTLNKYMIRNCNRFGSRFVLTNIKSLLPYWRIIYKHFGLKQTVSNIIHELHLKKHILHR